VRGAYGGVGGPCLRPALEVEESAHAVEGRREAHGKGRLHLTEDSLDVRNFKFTCVQPFGFARVDEKFLCMAVKLPRAYVSSRAGYEVLESPQRVRGKETSFGIRNQHSGRKSHRVEAELIGVESSKMAAQLGNMYLSLLTETFENFQLDLVIAHAVI